MVVSAFLMAAGAAAKHYGPTLHIHHGLPTSIRGPLHGIGLSLSGTEFAVLFIVLGVCYLGVLLFADSVRFRVGVGAIVALHLIFVIAPPLLSSDIFNYVGYARLDAVHHLTPMSIPSSAAPTDPSYIYVGWPLNTTAYGPLFTLGNPAARLGQLHGRDLAAQVACRPPPASPASRWSGLCATRLGGPRCRPRCSSGSTRSCWPTRWAVGTTTCSCWLAALGGIYMLLAGRETRDGGAGRRGGGEELVGGAAALRAARVAAAVAGDALGSARGGGGRRSSRWLAFGTHISSLLHVLQHDARLETPNDIPE